MLGPPIVQGQYEENLMRLGNAYANGDQNARETLKDVVINLQLTLLATLRMALLDNLELDFAALQRASDESRISALVCLFQLGQRLSLGSPSMHPKAPLATSTSPTRPAALSDPGSSSSPFAGSSSSAAVTDPRKPPPIPPMSPHGWPRTRYLLQIQATGFREIATTPTIGHPAVSTLSHHL